VDSLPPVGLLARDFLARPAPEVAPGLLGCVLAHQTAAGLVAVELTEVEAYAGESDPASHAYRGQTARTAVMFGPPGYAYVYFTYGRHFCVNVVCESAGTAAAVLLRAGRVIVGEPLARQARGAWKTGAARGQEVAGAAMAPDIPFRDLARGPARLCQALDITRALDGANLLDPASPLRLYAPPAPSVGVAVARAVSAGPRVGISAATDVPWRFWMAGDPTVSAYRLHKPRSR
jgi:DNA-3-methyladenine glycosylase